jgi:hypothetical protein
MVSPSPSSASSVLSPERQIRHLVGLAAFMDWLNRWRGNLTAISQAGQTIVLGTQPSERFGIALPRHKLFGKAPALLCQADEAEWITQIKWSRAQRLTDGLALVAQRQLGVGELPSLPAFALIIQLRGQAAQVPFEKAGRLDLRKFWNDEGLWQVEGGRPFQVLPVSSSSEPLFGPDDLRQGATFRELVQQRAARGAKESDPGFRGGAADLSKFSQDYFLQPSTAPKED